MRAASGAARGSRAVIRRSMRDTSNHPTNRTARPSRTQADNDATDPKGRDTNSQPVVGTRYPFTCPVCGGRKANATYKRDRSGRTVWFVGCFSTGCRELGGEYLNALAEKVGAPSGAAVKESPVQYLTALPSLRRSKAPAGDLPEMPSRARFTGWAKRLLSTPEPMAYLTEERGLTPDVIETLEIGWDGERLMFPMRVGGEIVAYKTRVPRPRAQMRCCSGPGRPWPLYPEPDPDWSWLVLTAGELDAARLLSAGLPACSVSLGAGTWRDDWTGNLDGRPVAVLFDNNETDLARERAAALRSAGLDARRIDLRRLGLKGKKADVSDYLNGGGSVRRLRDLALGKVG